MISAAAAHSVLSRESNAATLGHTIDEEMPRQTGRLSRRRCYRVYLPPGYSQQQQYPLVMVLHGCRQDHLAIQSICGFDSIADREGFVVVYPFVTRYTGFRIKNCWGWWLARHRQRDRGEVADLSRIARRVVDRYAINPDQLYICGLSSGAAMSVASLISYSDLWCKGASVAGVPYAESSRSVRISKLLPVRSKRVDTLVRLASHALFDKAPPLLVIQSSADQVVGKKLGANLRDTWIRLTQVSDKSAYESNGEIHSVKWSFSQYNNSAGRTMVSCLMMNRLKHCWPGGLPGRFGEPDAPNVAELIWAFFKQV